MTNLIVTEEDYEVALELCAKLMNEDPDHMSESNEKKLVLLAKMIGDWEEKNIGI